MRGDRSGARSGAGGGIGGDPDRRRGFSRDVVGGEQVEGRQAVRELLVAGRRRVKELWLVDGLDPSTQLDEIERWCARRHVRVQVVSQRRLDSVARTDAPQGVVAFADPIEPVDLDDLCEASGAAVPMLLVLDGVTDPHNVGSLLRSAACAGVSGVVLARHRAAHVTPTVAKVAAGAAEHVPIALVPGVPAALARLADAGVRCIGLDADAPTALYDLGGVADGPVALVLGSEGKGLSQLTRRRCDIVVSIPQRGGVASLNVATAGAVACFDLARRRRTAGQPRAADPIGAGQPGSADPSNVAARSAR